MIPARVIVMYGISSLSLCDTVAWSLATLGRLPVDILIWYLNIASLAVNATVHQIVSTYQNKNDDCRGRLLTSEH